jgi:hypothetical protein
VWFSIARLFYSRPLIPESSQQPYQLRTPKTLSLSDPRMSRRNDEDAEVRPISRPCSPSAISTSGDLPTAETALPSVHLSDTIDSSKGQCTETSHAGAWIEETRREGCYHNDRAPVRFLSLFDESPLDAACVERYRRARALQRATLRNLSNHQLRLNSTCGGRFDDIFALMVLRLRLIRISKPYITPKLRQETQRTILWRRCAINDLV